MLVVAVVAAAATAMVSRQQIDIRRSQNIFARDQAYAYAIGAENYALNVLRADLQAGADTDNLSEFWAQSGTLPAFEGAQISMEGIDLQGRFNLNNLTDASGEPVPAQVERFQRLLTVLGLNPGITDAVLDWIDPNVDPRPSGAEDDIYTSKDTPYRTANRPLRSASELRLVHGVDGGTFETLEPYVTALPSEQTTAINVNTAPAPVLASLAAGISLEQAEQLVERRPPEGYGELSELTADPLYAGKGNQLDTGSLGLTSSYFLFRSTVALGRARAQISSLIRRNGSQVTVLARGTRVL